jgi:leader peptidase (prepilin peptidase)/N-methyltransferase
MQTQLTESASGAQNKSPFLFQFVILIKMFFLFLIGIFIGSFLNVIIDRLPRKETIAKGRSYCEFCKKELSWYDLIPLLSFLMLKGKCRYCHKKLSLYYPIIELSTGILFALTYSWVLKIYPLPFSFYHLIYYLIIISAFIIILFEDLKFGIIPDKVVFPAIVITLFYLIFNSQFVMLRIAGGSIFNYLFSAILTCTFFLILFLITKGKGMGFGDVKLAFLLGLILGFPKIILALYLAFLTGAIVGIILILWKKKRSIKETIPFGPFLIAGSLLSLFLGDLILPGIISFLGF